MAKKPTTVIGTGRLSFPHLFEAKAQLDQDGNETDRFKHVTDFLIPKDAVLKRPGMADLSMESMLKSLRVIASDAAKYKWKGGPKAIPSEVRLYITKNQFMRDGDELFTEYMEKACAGLEGDELVEAQEEATEKYSLLKGHYRFRASNWPHKNNGAAKFNIVGKNPRQIIDDEEEVYGGRFANLQVSAYAYAGDSAKQIPAGVSFILENVQLTDIDGEKGEPFFDGMEADMDASEAFGGASENDASNYEEDGDDLFA